MNEQSRVVVWRDRAECRNAPPNLFYPAIEADASLAKIYCSACEVRVECLDHALREREEYGVWGGLSERERENLRMRVATRRTFR